MMIFEELVEKTLSQIGDEDLDFTVSKVIQTHFPAETQNTLNWIKKIKCEIEGWGPLEESFKDPEISEICINSFDHILIEKEGTLTKLPRQFASPLTYLRFIKRLLGIMEKSADQRLPLVEGMLDSQTRIHIALPPITQVPTVTIRRHCLNSWSLQELLKMKMMSDEEFENLQKWISDKKNILVCGPTNSGKTTLLKSLIMSCNASERIVSLEDTCELKSSHMNHINLRTRVDIDGLVPTVDLSQLLKTSLRMRPDRIVVGEVRGEEAPILLDALSTGHKGSMSTIHASSASQALKRLEALVSRTYHKWNLMAIRQLIFDSIDVIIVCEKKNGLRKISQTALISGIEEFGYLLSCF